MPPFNPPALHSQRAIHSRLQRLVAAGRRTALILFRVDAHPIGDRARRVIAGQLQHMTDRVGVVGRFGGDGFVVLLPDHSRAEAQAFVQAFWDCLSSGGFPLALSYGLALFPDDAADHEGLLAQATARFHTADHPGPGLNGRRRNGLGAFDLLQRLVCSIDSKDNYTRAHCEKTAEYALLLAHQLRLSPADLRPLRLAALLHDVGKIAIPDDILRKPGPLTVEEFAVVKHHVSIAANLIVDIPNAGDVRGLILHHHERWDGGGYPDGLAGEQIPFLARLLAVADAFAAVTLNRPHRPALPFPEAYRELERAAGSQLDPQLVQAFATVVGQLLERQQGEAAAPSNP